jgi:hypothetical protein
VRLVGGERLAAQGAIDVDRGQPQGAAHHEADVGSGIAAEGGAQLVGRQAVRPVLAAGMLAGARAAVGALGAGARTARGEAGQSDDAPAGGEVGQGRGERRGVWGKLGQDQPRGAHGVTPPAPRGRRPAGVWREETSVRGASGRAAARETCPWGNDSLGCTVPLAPVWPTLVEEGPKAPRRPRLVRGVWRLVGATRARLRATCRGAPARRVVFGHGCSSALEHECVRARLLLGCRAPLLGCRRGAA